MKLVRLDVQGRCRQVSGDMRALNCITCDYLESYGVFFDLFHSLVETRWNKYASALARTQIYGDVYLAYIPKGSVIHLYRCLRGKRNPSR